MSRKATCAECQHLVSAFLILLPPSGASMPNPLNPSLVGVALDKQLLSQPETVPVTEHDWRVDMVLLGDGQVLEGD